MNKVKYAVIILLIILISCILGSIYFKTTVDHFKVLIEQIMEYVMIEDYDKATEIAEILSIEWTKREHILAFIVHNKEIDEITFNMPRLESYIDKKYVNELRAECEKIMTVLDHMWYIERPSLYNLL